MADDARHTGAITYKDAIGYSNCPVSLEHPHNVIYANIVERHTSGMFSNKRQLDSLFFNTLFSLPTKKASKLRITMWGESIGERPRGAGFRSVNPAERWHENPARALARAGFSQHLECGIHRSESSPEGLSH